MPSDLSRAGSALAPGERVGHYTIERPLASGGFGVIYRATHADEGTPAALKVLHAELASAPGAVLRFEREIEAITRLRHPNIIDIYAWGRLPDGRPYFIMELLSGESLETHLQRRGRMPPDEVLAILTPLCAALATVHERGVIHRDLSPSNVFLADRDGATHVVLLDFGVAKMLDAPQAPGLTTPSRPVGTPACMAPEQIRMQPAAPQTDVYALGVLTYAMLTGQLPFNDPSLMVMQSMHLYVTPARPSAAAPIDPALDDVVLRAMSKRPDQRYASTLDLLAAFQAALAGGGATRALHAGADSAIALAIEIKIDPEAAEDPDAALTADIDAIHALAARGLGERGLEAVASAGNTMLFAVYLPADAEGERAGRLGCVHAALALRGALDARPTRDLRVQVGLCLHAGVARSPDETLADGDLWDVPSWAYGAPPDGISASAEALRGLSIPARPLDEAGHLFCI